MRAGGVWFESGLGALDLTADDSNVDLQVRWNRSGASEVNLGFTYHPIYDFQFSDIDLLFLVRWVKPTKIYQQLRCLEKDVGFTHPTLAYNGRRVKEEVCLFMNITISEAIECIELSYSDVIFPFSLTKDDEKDQPDREDIQYFKDVDRSYALDKERYLLHATYALRYFQLPATQYFLPRFMIAFIDDKFRYQPIADSIVLGLVDHEWNLGRHVAHMTTIQKNAVSTWLGLLGQLGLYDTHDLFKAKQVLI